MVVIMKKLFVYCFTDGIQSFAPILMWVILPLVFCDSMYAEGFILTYPYQFIFGILYSLLFTSQLKYEKKENIGVSNSYTGLILLYLVSVIIFFISVMFYDKIAVVLGFELDRFPVFIFSLWNLVLDWVFMGLLTRKQYNGGSKFACWLAYLWHLSKLCFIFVLSLFLGHNAVLMITGLVYGVILLGWFFNNIVKLRFNIAALKFSIDSVSYNIGMTLVYVFGINNLSSVGYLAEYNMMSLCTDTQWDVLSTGIDTDTTLNVVEGNYNKKLYIRHIAYSIILLVSSLILLFIVSLIPVYRDNLDFRYIFITLMMEMIWFPFYGVVYTMSSWITIMKPSILQAVVNFVRYSLRIILTFIIVSDYTVSFAMIGACVIGNIMIIGLYYYLRSDNSGSRVIR